MTEFLQVMQPRTKTRTWANEVDAVPATSTEMPEAPDDGQREGETDLEWMRRRMKKGISNTTEAKAFEQSDDEIDLEVSGTAAFRTIAKQSNRPDRRLNRASCRIPFFLRYF